MNAAKFEGGCACGAVRYRLASTPFDAGYCHCTICRRVSGAPLLAYATVPLGDYLVTGVPKTYRSSSFGERTFCGGCGSPLTMHVDHQPETIDFTIASLDEPALVVPQFHLFTSRRIAWFDVADGLPRYARLRPDTRGL